MRRMKQSISCLAALTALTLPAKAACDRDGLAINTAWCYNGNAAGYPTSLHILWEKWDKNDIDGFARYFMACQHHNKTVRNDLVVDRFGGYSSACKRDDAAIVLRHVLSCYPLSAGSKPIAIGSKPSWPPIASGLDHCFDVR
ncbi:hypothetical protein ACU4GA_09030 [Methylobacterium oryzae CBMB20]